ncbi:tRNA (N6-isopentenyl adenosine(37)-C2)-methylthiotransferase MiaB [Caloranaerobacter ferrireducens]|uniref:tRNA (N6-isopentenyl adenosine(37)-C2)-methylthiotransferase MiaB n=1 Tax=Caloranaerobacter ferrireducens TaxID=1323370 RepID=UPI000ADE2907|nr:tRNA (N6-isopentenyl adenosine(37)-C2)-methylthiotransferase MiaB [Caloranaerobacter ferrireducens]
MNKVNNLQKRKYYIETWGCQMNEHDSEKMSGILENIGYIETNTPKEADLIIFNTCLVRENAELKVYGNLGHLKTLKSKKPEMLIAVCGCMMQKKEIRNLIKEKYSHVDIVFGTHNIHRLPELIANARQSSKMIIDVWDDSENVIEGLPAKRKYSFKAFVNVMHGCNNFCTYCIVPYTRGREKSRLPEDILKEINELAAQGCKEVTLLGQNVNSYGKTLDKKVSFAQLLRMVNEVEGIERIRFTTSHPKDLSDELILAIKECDKICEHIHLPFQAGSNKILKAMNRKYTKEHYLNLIEKIKKEIPDIAITTDIIVGFPGETEEDFEETLDVVRKVKFDSAFTFLYSIRKGTPAAEMKNQVPEDIKHKRFQRLLDTIYPISLEINQKLKDKIVEVLVEEISKTDKTKVTGRTRTNKVVHFPGDKNLIGKLVNVKITNPKTWTLEGELID